MPANASGVDSWRKAQAGRAQDSANEAFNLVTRQCKLGEKIGRGSYAQVHAATTCGNEEVAVKVRNLFPERYMRLGQRDKVLKSSFKEVVVWKALGSHENCVGLLDSFFDSHLSYMVMEKCACSLFQFLHGSDLVNEITIGRAFEQMLVAIAYMHSVGVVHRDIKPDNFLVGGKHGDTVKICDFNLSAMLPPSGFFRGALGTAPYMPPEMLYKQSYDQKADVWSFGVVAYLFLCGEFPYQSSDGSPAQMKESIVVGGAPECRKAWLSDKAISFLQHVLKRNPQERATPKSALKFAYIKDRATVGYPCLREVLDCAKLTGAFTSFPVETLTETDLLLKQLKKGQIATCRNSFTAENVDNAVSAYLADSMKVPAKSSEVAWSPASTNNMSEVAWSPAASTTCDGSQYDSTKFSEAVSTETAEL